MNTIERSSFERDGATLSRRRTLSRLAGGALAVAAMPALPLPALANTGDEVRKALVIGNAEYAVAPLNNPVNDARLVGDALADLRFDVTRVENAGHADMVRAVRRWIVASRNADVRAFYFAGHGTQFRGQNYLIPVDLAIEREDQLDRAWLRLSTIVEALSAQDHGVNFVIVDACRTAPESLLRRRTRGLDSEMSAGFTPEIAPRGTVIAYSTSPGSLAADGKGSRNSVFTRAFANTIRQPGLPVETVFKRIRVSVMRATENAQVPWESSSLIGDFCFRRNARGACVPE